MSIRGRAEAVGVSSDGVTLVVGLAGIVNQVKTGDEGSGSFSIVVKVLKPGCCDAKVFVYRRTSPL